LRILTKNAAFADQVAEDYTKADLQPEERAMLDFAVKLTRSVGTMSETDLDTLRAAGWSDEDCLDIAETASMFNLTNRLANSLGWQPNPEYHQLGR
jgi:uncharacterized peroxidase-related enzyme